MMGNPETTVATHLARIAPIELGAGRQAVRDGVSTTVDEAALRADVQTRAMRLAGR